MECSVPMGDGTVSSMIKNSQRLVIVAFFLALSGCLAAAHAGTYKGRAIAIDADSIYVDDTEIRLFGVDAPEARQTCADAAGAAHACGRRARAWLLDLIGKEPVSATITAGMTSAGYSACAGSARLR
jgi:endonuclease YncB( thermonuclease family)